MFRYKFHFGVVLYSPLPLNRTSSHIGIALFLLQISSILCVQLCRTKSYVGTVYQVRIKWYWSVMGDNWSLFIQTDFFIKYWFLIKMLILSKYVLGLNIWRIFKHFMVLDSHIGICTLLTLKVQKWKRIFREWMDIVHTNGK